ncbi:MAG: SDR family oxidoreductase [Nitrospinae bacterium]|nr:SDR family oxidoreductase [Nitrospinota bacterium]
MKILVTGAAGQIGHRVALHLAARHHVVAAVRTGGIPGIENVTMDIAEPLSVRIAVDHVMPDAVVHCAAMTNADDCEKDRALCRRVNVDGARALAEESARVGAKLVYVSTDLVFDGAKGNYAEDDKPNPLSYYAETKLEGERITAATMADYAIARTAVVFGKGGIPPRGFAVWLVETLRAGKKVRLYTDQFRSHFYLGDCAAAIGLMLEKKLTGLYHLSPGRKESRHAFGMALAEKLGLDRSLIEAIGMDDAAMDAKRPKDCSLSNARFVAATGFEPSALGKSLEYLKSEFEG